MYNFRVKKINNFIINNDQEKNFFIRCLPIMIIIFKQYSVQLTYMIVLKD